MESTAGSGNTAVNEDVIKRLFAQGSQAAKSGDHTGAYAHFSEALQGSAGVELQSALLVSRSGVLGAQGRWTEALTDAEECQKIRPSWSRTYECKAAAFIGLGRSKDAELARRLAASLAALKQDPKNEDLKKQVRVDRQEIAANEASKPALGAEQSGTSHPTPATNAAAHPQPTSSVSAAQVQPESEEAKLKFQQGTQANKAEHYDEAYEYFSQGLSVATTLELKSALLVSRGVSLCAMKRFEEALVDAEDCIRLRKSWARSFTSQAAALHGLGRTDEAERATRLAAALSDLKQDPKNEDLKKAVRTVRLEIVQCALQKEAQDEQTKVIKEQGEQQQQQHSSAVGVLHSPVAPVPDTVPAPAHAAEHALTRHSKEEEADFPPQSSSVLSAPPALSLLDEALSRDKPTHQQPEMRQKHLEQDHASVGSKEQQVITQSSTSRSAPLPPNNNQTFQPSDATEIPPNHPINSQPPSHERLPEMVFASSTSNSDFVPTVSATPTPSGLEPVTDHQIESSRQRGTGNGHESSLHQPVLESESEEAKRMVSEANSCQRRGDFEGAHTLYTHALKHVRNRELQSAIYFNRSVALARVFKWEESLQDANECVKINPKWPRGPECQGTALEGLGRLHEALTAFETALTLEPGNQAIKQTMQDIRQSIAQHDHSTPPHHIMSSVATYSQQTHQPILHGDASVLGAVSATQFMTQKSLPEVIRGSETRAWPQLVKASFAGNIGPDAIVQVGNEHGKGTWAKWTVHQCRLRTGANSLRDFFPNFPRLEDVLPQINKSLSHTVHLCANNTKCESTSLTGMSFRIPSPNECESKAVSCVIIEGFDGATVLMDDVTDEIRVIGCRNVDLFVGGIPPNSGIMLVECYNCNLIVGNNRWRLAVRAEDSQASVRSTASSEIYLVLINEPSEYENTGLTCVELVERRQTRRGVEKVLLPDFFSTKLQDGSLSTTCIFSMDEVDEVVQQHHGIEAAVPKDTLNLQSPSLVPAALPQMSTVASLKSGLHTIQPSTPFLGSGVLQFQLKLALDSDMARQEGRRRSFESMLLNDLSLASGLPANNFRLTSLVGNLSANVDAHLQIQDGIFFDGLQLASILEKEFTDPTSQFRRGDITKHTQAMEFPFDKGFGVVGFKHKLDIDYSEAGREGSLERITLHNKYLFDLCNATGLQANRFRIKDVAPGSIIIEAEIHPESSGSGPHARSVLANLDRQAMDPYSLLRYGDLTRFTQSEVQTSINMPSRQPSLSDTPGLPPAIPIQTLTDLPPAIPVQDLMERGNRNMTFPSLQGDATALYSSTNSSQGEDILSKRSVIGIAVSSRSDGFFVADILPGSPAFMGGIQKGDFLEKIDGLPLTDLDILSVVRMLRGLPGTPANVEVRRNLPASQSGGVPASMRFAISVTRPWMGPETTSSVQVGAVSPHPPPPAFKHAIEGTDQADPRLGSPAYIPHIDQGQSKQTVGVGLGISKDNGGQIKVSDILPGSSSHRDGSIQINDIVETVDGFFVSGLNPNDVVALVRGYEGSLVKLGMIRSGLKSSGRDADWKYSVVLERSVSKSTSLIDCQISLTLDMNMWEVEDDDTFKQEVAHDVAQALGSLVARVQTLGLRAGSVIVDMLMSPHAKVSGTDIVRELISQARNPLSVLMRGKHTCRTAAVFEGPKATTATKPTKSKMWASPMTGTLGPSSAFRDNKIVRDAELDMKRDYPLAPRVAPVPLVSQPDSVLWGTEGRQGPRAGIGLGLTAGKGLVYTVCGLTPGGAAEASGQLQRGDVVHSIDGTIVTGKTIGEIQEMVIGEAGTKVMVAVLRSDALPEDLELDLHQFERWRPVVLVRSVARSENTSLHPDHNYFPQLSSAGSSKYGSDASARKSIWPLRDGREVVAVDLVLDEDYQVVAPTVSEKAFFNAQLTHDIAGALQIATTQVLVIDLLPGSVIAVIEFLPTGDHDVARDPEELAMELIRQASNKNSPLRQCVSCRRAKHARPRVVDKISTLHHSDMDRISSYASRGGQQVSDDDMSRMEGGSQWMSLGLALRKGPHDRLCTVQYLRQGGPAEQSGCMFVGNLIWSVDDRSMDGIPLSEVLSHLGEGDWGSVVNVGVLRLKGTRGALPDQNVTTLVALRRSLQQDSTTYSRTLVPKHIPSDHSFPLKYTGPCRIVVLQREFDPRKAIVGVGIVLQRLLSSGQLLVVSMPETGVAAASNQVFIGDVLHQVDNVPTSGKNVTDVVRMIQGSPGSSVVLMLQSTLQQTEADRSILYSSMHADTSSHSQEVKSSDAEFDQIPVGQNSDHRPTAPVHADDWLLAPENIVRSGSDDHLQKKEIHNGDLTSTPSGPEIKPFVRQPLNPMSYPRSPPATSTPESQSTPKLETAPITPFTPTTATGYSASPTTGIPVTRHHFAGASGVAPVGQGAAGMARQVSSGAGVESPMSPMPMKSPAKLKARGVGSATVSMLLLSVSNLTGRNQGDVMECKVRLLHPSRKPLVLGIFTGVWNAATKTAEFKSQPLLFDIPPPEVGRAQIESTLWEPAPTGKKGRGFIGEVIVNTNRLHAMAQQQPGIFSTPANPLKTSVEEHRLSEDFEFMCKSGWTFTPVRPVDGKMRMRLEYTSR